MKYSKKEEKLAKLIISSSIKEGKINQDRLMKSVVAVKKIRPSRAVALLKIILREVQNFYKNQTLVVESAEKIHSDYLKKIQSVFGKNHAFTKVEFKENPTLLAGLKISLGDNVWDYSVNSRLESLKKGVND